MDEHFLCEIPTLAEGETRQRVQIFPPASDKTYAHPKQKFKLTQDRLDGFAADIAGRDSINADRDHAFAKKLPAPAAGWVVKGTAEVTSDGLFADVEWTASAADQIRAREYRFISPEFAFETVTNDGRKSKQPKLAAISLTNRPFFDEMEPIAAEDETELGAEGADDNEGGNGMTLTAELAEKLGIAADASEDEVAEAIANLAAENETLKKDQGEKEDQMKTLIAQAGAGAEAAKELGIMKRDSAIDAAVERNAIIEASRGQYEGFYAIDPSGTLKLLAELPDGNLFKVEGDTKAVVVDAEGKPVETDTEGRPVTADLAAVTIQGSEYDVDEQSAKIAATASEILRKAGKTSPTEEEFLTASEQAKTQLGI